MNQKSDIHIKDFTYNLPNEKIAAHPLAERDSSKLLVYKSGKIVNDVFTNLPNHLPNHATLVINNTRVIEARIFFQKETGGVIEIFCLEPAKLDITSAMAQTGSVQWNCLIGGASKWKHGLVLKKNITVNNTTLTLSATYVERLPDSFVVAFSWEPANVTFAEVIHVAGAIPLPPYIKRVAEDEDVERYQTVFAQHLGSVAAPTAALHFTQNTFNKLQQKDISVTKVTLHVGAGTFKPVKSETIAEHDMHAEHFQITTDALQQLIAATQIIAVGTTSLRTLESLYWIGIKLIQQKITNTELTLEQWEPYELDSHNVTYAQSLEAILTYLRTYNLTEAYCRTSLIIIPGYKFASAKALVTNFHQPQSTLLLLVAAFIGADWHNVYEHALNNDYRFLSYGDSSLLWRNDVD